MVPGLGVDGPGHASQATVMFQFTCKPGLRSVPRTLVSGCVVRPLPFVSRVGSSREGC